MDRKLTPLNATDNNIGDLLWSNKHEKWHIKDICRTTNVTRYNVDSLFLQLIGSVMILVSKIDGIIQWTVAEQINYTNGRAFTLVCEEIESWIGINVF